MKKNQANTLIKLEKRYQNTWALALAFLLLLGQIALLQHVVTHQLEQAIAQDDDHCSFCAVGSHADTADAPPPVFEPLGKNFVYEELNIQGVVGFSLRLLHICGPPQSSIV